MARTPGGSRRRTNRILSFYAAALAAANFAAAAVGLTAGKLGLLVVFGPMAAFFGWVAWLVWPRHVSEADARRMYERQNAVFKRIGIRGLIGPDWDEDERP